jgi:hypothetical protein
MNDFKKGYQPRTNLVEDKTEELLAVWTEEILPVSY